MTKHIYTNMRAPHRCGSAAPSRSKLQCDELHGTPALSRNVAFWLRAGTPTLRTFTVLLSNVEATDTSKLSTLLQSLADLQSVAVRVHVVLALATSPSLLLPRLPASALSAMSPFLLKLATPRQALDRAIHNLQVWSHLWLGNVFLLADQA